MKKRAKPIHLNEEEKSHLLECINLAIKSSENAINAARILAPIAEKLAPTTSP